MSTEARPNYWCHVCDSEVSIYMTPDPTCQSCHGQFIEELQPDDDPRTFLSGMSTEENAPGIRRQIFLPEGGSTQFFSVSQGGNRGEMGDDVFQYFGPRQPTEEGNTENEPNMNAMMQTLLNSLMNQSQQPNANEEERPAAPTPEGGTEAQRPLLFYGNMVNGNFRFQPVNQEQQEDTQTNTNDARGNVANSILQFLSAMTGGTLGEGLAGNPNDYAFSQTALDNIITQLMEQAGGGSAPPPASEQVIESLPKRELTEKEKKQEADCAVCKDMFGMTEQVIQLPCEHIFHDDCIRPWLKLNSTCPVCRKSVLPENNEDTENTCNNQVPQENHDLDLD